MVAGSARINSMMGADPAADAPIAMTGNGGYCCVMRLALRPPRLEFERHSDTQATADYGIPENLHTLSLERRANRRVPSVLANIISSHGLFHIVRERILPAIPERRPVALKAAGRAARRLTYNRSINIDSLAPH